MRKIWPKLTLLITKIFLLTLLYPGQPAHAQSPPFSFNLNPSYENGKITYTIEFFKNTDETLADVIFKIPLPTGSRFLDAQAQPTTSVNFDGKEITFFTATPYQPIKNASFTVEAIDPEQTEFTTQAWIAWQGDFPGDYLMDETKLDLTKQPLDWARPQSRLNIEAKATVDQDTVTYTFYPRKRTNRRMWDLKIRVPLPQGTTLLSAEAPPPFVTDFDGQEVSFSLTEMDRQRDTGPLTIKVSAADVTDPFIVTHAWATWKNVGRSVGRSVVYQEEIRSGDIVAQPHTTQLVAADFIGDTPFAFYDLTSIALQKTSSSFQVNFYTAGQITPVGEPLEYIVYIDTDCNIETGGKRGNRGAEYWIRYRHENGKAYLYSWDQAENQWGNRQTINVDGQAAKMISVSVPNDYLSVDQQFCWLGRVWNRSDAYRPNPPNEWVGSDSRLTHYESNSNDLSDPSLDFSDAPQSWGFEVLESDSSMPNIHGALAVPQLNQSGQTDVAIFALPNGEQIATIPNASQPNFSFDGRRILVNRDGDANLNTIVEYNLDDGTEKQVSDAEQDSYPFYDTSGNRVVYANPELPRVGGKPSHSSIFVQCGLLPPHQEVSQQCRDIVQFRSLIPAGQVGEIWGNHPVWAANDLIAYNGCNSWVGSASCGIFTVPSDSIKPLSEGFTPRQLTDDTSDIPTDTKHNLIAFMSHQEGNWEVYLMDVNGDGIRNLSNSPTSSDGLPTISPDGDWIAFVSNRDGAWAVWGVRITDGYIQKLFSLPAELSNGQGDDSWTNERISWGP